MRLVLQCAMCGTHHPVGTLVCSACRASGVTQLRLMFECPTCGNLGINPACDACLPVAGELPYSVVDDEELIVAEEIEEDAFLIEEPDEETEEELDLDFDDEEADEKLIVDLTEDEDEEDEYEDDDDEDDD